MRFCVQIGSARAEAIRMVKKGFFGRPRRSKQQTRRGSKSERGASTVEFALIAPLFFAVVFGGIEIGLMFRNYLALEDMSRSSARIASIERDDPGADGAILARIDQRADQLQGDLKLVVIFNADTLDAEVPADCLTASRAGICNSYDLEVTDIDTVIAGSAWESGWASTDRDAFDNIGIYIEYDYQYVTGFFDTLTLSTTTVEVIELDL